MGNMYQSMRAKHMIKLRDNGETYSHIAELYELTPSRVRQIVMIARKKIENQQKLKEAKIASVKSGLVRTINDFNNLSIDVLDLSVRARNCLENESLFLIGDVIKKTDAELLRIPNFGRKSLNLLKEAIEDARVKYGFEPQIVDSDYEKLSRDGKVSIELVIKSLAKIYKDIDDDELRKTAGVSLMALLLMHGYSKDETISKFDRIVS